MIKKTMFSGITLPLLALFQFTFVQSCKKDLLVPKVSQQETGTTLKVISLSEFKSAVDLASLGKLKPRFESVENSTLSMGIGDKVQSPDRFRALGILLAITTLHEFVHYGRDINKLTSKVSINGSNYESGLIFELSISPPYDYNYINRNNAIDWANFYKFNIND